MKRWWTFFKSLKQNPVYLREKGSWGRPNPFYETLRRYSPFLVLGAIVLGLCGGISNPLLVAADSEFFFFYCLLCLPGVLLSMLTTFGMFMAPALTAPSISLEMDRGTWDILRLTPQSTADILMAKLFGALARLRIWPVLFVLCLFQGGLILCVAALGPEVFGLWGIMMGLVVIFRPWLEIFFAACTGLYVSTWVRSATVALVGAYAAVIIVRALNSSGVWLALSSAFGWESNRLFIGGVVGPTAVYALLIPALLTGVIHRAKKLETLYN